MGDLKVSQIMLGDAEDRGSSAVAENRQAKTTRSASGNARTSLFIRWHLDRGC
jgi:hypothetical protein